MKVAFFWDILPCSLVESDRHFRGAYSLHHFPDNGGSTHRETSVWFDESTWCYIPEGYNVHTYRRV